MDDDNDAMPGFFSFVMSAKVYIGGGLDPDTGNNLLSCEMLGLDGDGEEWRPVGNIPFEMRYASATVYKDFAFLFGVECKDVVVFKDNVANDAAADNDQKFIVIKHCKMKLDHEASISFTTIKWPY